MVLSLLSPAAIFHLSVLIGKLESVCPDLVTTTILITVLKIVCYAAIHLVSVFVPFLILEPTIPKGKPSIVYNVIVVLVGFFTVMLIVDTSISFSTEIRSYLYSIGYVYTSKFNSYLLTLIIQVVVVAIAILICLEPVNDDDDNDRRDCNETTVPTGPTHKKELPNGSNSQSMLLLEYTPITVSEVIEEQHCSQN